MPKLDRPDTRQWAETLGISTFDRDMPPEASRALAIKIIHNASIVTSNVLCKYLGNGSAESAIELMSRCNIEVTEVGFYNAWLRERWGITSFTKENQSDAIIKVNELDSKDKDYILSICKEDISIYERIRDRMEKSGAASVYAHQLWS